MTDLCSQTIEWYIHKTYWRRILAHGFGCAAIIILGLSAVIPVLRKIFDMPRFSPMFGTVAAILAGVLLGLDRFGGWSRSWIRFTQTALALTLRPSGQFMNGGPLNSIIGKGMPQ